MPTIYDSSYIFEDSAVCFTDGCNVTVQFPLLSDNAEQLTTATVTIYFNGDLGQLAEFFEVKINGQSVGTCQSAALDCSPTFETCSFNVLAEVAAGAPLVVMLETTSAVNDICSNDQFENFALQAQFELTIECSRPFKGDITGCIDATPPSSLPSAEPTILEGATPTGLPTPLPTSLPTPVPTPFDFSYTFEEPAICFDDGCDVTAQFPGLSDQPDKVEKATLTVHFRGDLGQSYEYVDLYVNGQTAGPCPTSAGDCNFDFETCSVDALPEVVSGAPLAAVLASNYFVNAYCDNTEFVNYAIQARFELSIECAFPLRAAATGCIGTLSPTGTPTLSLKPTSPSATPTIAPTSLPSGIPSLALLPPALPTTLPTPAFQSVTPSIQPVQSFVPTPYEPFFTFEDSGVCFDDGCALTVQFPQLSDDLNKLQQATVTVFFKGDLGESTSEFLDLDINGQLSERCRSTGSDCAAEYESCALNVLDLVLMETPLTVTLDATSAVNTICSDTNFTDFALRARFELTIECSAGSRGSSTGCVGSAAPTSMLPVS